MPTIRRRRRRPLPHSPPQVHGADGNPALSNGSL
jgi:hypothetical protein